MVLNLKNSSQRTNISGKTKKVIPDGEFPIFYDVRQHPDMYRAALESFRSVRDHFIDDYDYASIEDHFAALVEQCQGWFLAICDNQNKFGGVIFLNKWEGNAEKKQYHSCHLSGYANQDMAYKSIVAIRWIINMLLSKGLHKIYARMPVDNKGARFVAVRSGFKYEYTDKSATKKNGKLIDIMVYSVIEGLEDGK
jgi:RimJ/RimL family protein N-acetyltransferase